MQSYSLQGRIIVVAEKDEEVRHLLAESLRLQGFQVSEVKGPAHIEEPPAGLNPPALFLLGHGVSEKETFDAIALIRGVKTFEKIPIILIAVEPDENFKMEAVARGADSLLPFPFPMAVLHEKIEALLDGKPTSLLP